VTTEKPPALRDATSLCLWTGCITLFWLFSLITIPIFMTEKTPEGQASSLMGAIMIYCAVLIFIFTSVIVFYSRIKMQMARQFWYSSQCASFMIGLLGVVSVTTVPVEMAKTYKAYRLNSIETEPEWAGRILEENEPTCRVNKELIKADTAAYDVCDTLYKIIRFLDGTRRQREWNRLRSSIPSYLKEGDKVCVPSWKEEDGIVFLSNQHGVNNNMTCRVALEVKSIDMYYEHLKEIQDFDKYGMPKYEDPKTDVDLSRLVGAFGLSFVVCINILRIVADYFGLLKK
jgi:hypothetical protein